jgi:hypothetical protein
VTSAVDVAERLLAARARLGTVTSRADVAYYRQIATAILAEASDRGVLPLRPGTDYDVGAAVEWVHGGRPTVWFALRARSDTPPRIFRALVRLLRMGARLARARGPYQGPTLIDLLRRTRIAAAPERSP